MLAVWNTELEWLEGGKQTIPACFLPAGLDLYILKSPQLSNFVRGLHIPGKVYSDLIVSKQKWYWENENSCRNATGWIHTYSSSVRERRNLNTSCDSKMHTYAHVTLLHGGPSFLKGTVEAPHDCEDQSLQLHARYQKAGAALGFEWVFTHS